MNTTDARGRLQARVDEMRKLRDELRVQVHLASMDVKDLWNQLEPKIEQAESQLAAGTDVALTEMEKSLDAVRKALEEVKQRIHARSS